MSNNKDICFCSGDDRNKNIINVTRNNHQEYCNRWGYDYRTFDDISEVTGDIKEDDPFKVKTFVKLYFIQQIFEEGYDYASWLDQTDTLLMNHTIPLTEIITEDKYAFFSSSTSQWGDTWHKETYMRHLPLNGGWYVLKNTEWTRKFIEDSLAYMGGKDIPNDQFGMKNALWDRGYENYKDKITVRYPLQQSYWFYNKPDFNQNHNQLYRQCQSPYIYEKGDFMIHFAGQPNSDWLAHQFKDQVIK